MSALLWGLLWGLAALGALLALALLMPVRLRAEAGSDPARLQLRLRMLGGLVRVALVDTARPPPARVSARRRRKAGRRPEGRRGRPNGRQWRVLARAAFAALGRVRIEHCRIEARFGLEDPALTGELYGRLAGLLVAVPGTGAVRLVPVFDREILEGRGEIALSLVPARLLPVALRAARDWRRAVR